VFNETNIMEIAPAAELSNEVNKQAMRGAATQNSNAEHAWAQAPCDGTPHKETAYGIRSVPAATTEYTSARSHKQQDT
jgi:hypothetical protein